MKIGIFSDTHDNKQNIEKTRELFRINDVKLALFSGDLVSPFTIKFLSEFAIPIKAIFGNNEGDKWGINRRIKAWGVTNIEYAPKSGLFFEIEIDNLKIAIFHGHIEKFTDLLVKSSEYNLVVTGHTHVPHIKMVGKTTWINPGSVTGFSTDEPSITKGSIVIFDTESKKAEIIYL